DREPTPVKGDGLLYATPAGYGGWYASETEAHYPLGHEAPNTNEEFEVVAYGRYRFQENTLADLVQDPKQVALRPGKFKPGDPPVTVRTTSCHTVRVNVDCVRDYPVPRDAEVTVGLSDQKLRVISRQLPSLSSLTKVSYRPHQQQGKEE
ncbi:MAG: hypothetical protein KDD62_02405, partial [Bdellovibrionales bacterium]|nr:hypothetical protein [Bdellovibrionales bacterium]